MSTIKPRSRERGESPANHTPPTPAYVVFGPAQGPGGQPSALADRIAHHKRLIILTTLISAVAAALISFALPRTYRAEVLIKPVETEQTPTPLEGLATQFGGLASLAGLSAPRKGDRQEALAVLKSRLFSLRFLREEKLVPMLFPRRWDAARKQWIEDRGKGRPSEGEIYERFDHDVRHVFENGRTGLVTLAIDLKDREAAAHWANLLVERANQYLKKQAIEEANRSLDYLHKELAKTRVVEIQNAIYRLIEMQTQKIMLAHVRKEFAFKVIDPAIPPDARDYIWPNPWILAITGGMGGLMFALIVASLLPAKRRRETAAQAP